MRIPNGSQVFINVGLSGQSIAAATSGDAFNLAGYYGAMLLGGATSNGGGTTGTTYKVFRSATSNGTFNPFGASLTGIAAGSLGAVVVRNFLVNTSCTWHRVIANNNNNGSVVPVAFVLAFKGAYEPVLTQSSKVTVLSDVLVG
jgi:hypothetical protein